VPRYRFVGSAESVLHGLSHGVNALLDRDEHGQPDESTVVAEPGDLVETDEPYPHALMVNLETGETDVDDDEPAPAAGRKPARKRAPRKVTAPKLPDPEPTIPPADDDAEGQV
jgi:hypothetical protein